MTSPAALDGPPAEVASAATFDSEITGRAAPTAPTTRPPRPRPQRWSTGTAANEPSKEEEPPPPPPPVLLV